jgi:phage terminase small subunit
MLTDKQTAFVNYYTNGDNGTTNNATQSAIRAGYSQKTANEQGSRLLANVKIKQAIRAKRLEMAKEVDVRVSEIVAELRAIAFAQEASKPDKLRALELLGRYKAMFIDRHRDETASQPQPFDPAEAEALRVLSIQACRLHKPPGGEKSN